MRLNDGQLAENTPWCQQSRYSADWNSDNPRRALMIDRPLHLDSNDVALAMFYSSHCVDGSAVWPPWHLQSRGNGCLFAAVKVLGTITYLQKWSLPDGQATIRRGYADAIQLLNVALASPSQAQTDSTLLATMIMSAIETQAAPSQSSDYWEVHTKGAAALLQLRGASQVTSRLGSTLFFQVTKFMTTACILSGRRIPEELHRLRKATRAHLVDPAHPVWKYQGAMFRFTDFVAETRTDVSKLETQDLQQIVADALSIYNELVAIFEGASSVWQYERVPSVRFGRMVDYEHVYQTVLATQLWSGYRAAVIILCTMVARISNCLPSQVGFDTPVKQFMHKAIEIINDAAVDTIAAVPRPTPLVHSSATAPLGYGHDSSDGNLTQHAPVFQETQPDSQAIPHMHGCPLQWSVYYAANCEFVARPIRECILGILEHAAKTMQIQQWKISAENIKLELQRVPA